MSSSWIRRAADSTSRSVQRALDEVTSAVESAWVVRLGSEDELVVVDAVGDETRFSESGGRLRVEHSDGQTAVLLGGLQSVAFRASTGRRLREGEPVRVPGIAWRRPV